jgi:hypothetical protein
MNKPSRRAVVRTGVWAVPAVASVAVAPAFATSCTDCVTITGLVAGCKLPGNPRGKSYAIVLAVSNPSTTSTVNIDSIDIQVTGTPLQTATYCPDTFVVPPGDSQIIVYVSDLSNSQQKDANITVNYHSGANPEQSFPFTVNGFHPFNDNCPKDFDPDNACA